MDIPGAFVNFTFLNILLGIFFNSPLPVSSLSALRNPTEFSRHNVHLIHKRQTSLAPYFPQTSYTFSSQCSSGSYVGQVMATSYGSGGVTYSADTTTGSPYNIYINPSSGVITVASTPSGGFQFNLRATNSYGASVVPVIVVCSGYVNSGTTYPYGSSYPYGSTYPYGTGTTYPYNTYSPYGTTYPYNTGTPGVTYPFGTTYTGSTGSYPYNYGSTYPYTSTYPYNGQINPYGTGTYPYTNPAVTPYINNVVSTAFGQSSYQFTQSGCGGTLGSVSATNNSVYSISLGRDKFLIDGNGTITAAAGVPPGTYSLTVVSTSSSGTQTSVPVTVVISCTTTAPAGAGTTFGR